MRVFSALLSGLAFTIAAHGAVQPTKPDAALAQLELEDYLRTNNPALIEQLLARARQGLEADALRAPAEERIANVLLARGLDGAGIATLLSPHRLELVSVVNRDLAAYRLAVLGTRASLLALSRSQGVRAVFVDENPRASTTAIHDIPAGPPPRSAPPAGPAPPMRRLEIPRETPERAAHRQFMFLVAGYGDLETVPPMLENLHAQLRANAQSMPDAVHAGGVLFRPQMPLAKVPAFLARHGFELRSCVLRAPGAGLYRPVVTLEQRQLARGPGDIVQRIERAAAQERLRNARLADETQNPAAATLYRQIAESTNYSAYRLDVIGSVGELARLLALPEVFGVVYQADPAAADNHAAWKRYYERVGNSGQRDD